MLRIAVQSKGRLFEDTMALFTEADIKLSTSKRTLLTQSSNFPVEVLFLRDDDIPQYFDVAKYNKDHHYGVLSGRNLDDVLNTTRELDGQDEKHNPADFALWKCAQPEHIMRWPSPWSNGFPGWHCECTAMGRKYLGETFDIHGGGMDLVFPHHECEIAQAVASEGHQMVRYWMHNNMITINGQKMGKSLGNFCNKLQRD